MNDQQRKEISECIYDHVLISVDVFISSAVTENATQLKLDSDEESSLYKRIIQYAVTHGKDLQELFCTEHYCYDSCFVFDVKHFRDSFSDEESITSLLNIPKGVVAEILISFPARVNYDNKEEILESFKDIVAAHVDTIDEYQWDFFESRALTSATVSYGIDLNTGGMYDPEDDRNKILTLSRKDFVIGNITSSFEPEAYVKNLLTDAETIGFIEDHPVVYSKRGYYLYWNKNTEYSLESWLTFPAYPIGW